jgi:drug/metabolite transporter (DMT)-like permease
MQVWAQRHTPPTDAAILLSLEAVFAVLFGWLLLGEVLSPIQAIGCGLIFVAVLLAQIQIGRS